MDIDLHDPSADGPPTPVQQNSHPDPNFADIIRPRGVEVSDTSGGIINAFILLEGSLTGDIWHVAAASILSEYERRDASPSFPNLRFVTCMCVYQPEGSAPADVPGRGSYNYLRSIGLPVVVIKRTTPKMGPVSYQDVLNELLDQANQLPVPDWAGVLNRTRPLPPSGPQGEAEFTQGPMLLSLLHSTTVVMQMVQHLGKENAQRILGSRLSSRRDQGQPDDSVRNSAEAKFRELLHCIRQIRSTTNFERTLLLNYRAGDVNRQHDTNRGILESIKRACSDEYHVQRLAIICIPQMDPVDYELESRADLVGGSTNVPRFRNGDETETVFDLLDVIGQSPPLDNRTKAYFWRLVAERLSLTPPSQRELIVTAQPNDGETNDDRLIMGLIGGRSGSTDLPAFVGLSVMSWDERWFDYVARPDGLEELQGSYARNQIPQTLRLMNQHQLMGVCWLDRSTLKYFQVTYDGTNKPRINRTRWAPGPDGPRSNAVRKKFKQRGYSALIITPELREWIANNAIHANPINPEMAGMIDQYRNTIEDRDILRLPGTADPIGGVVAVGLDAYTSAVSFTTTTTGSLDSKFDE